MSDTQHGHVVPLAGGVKADCGGPSVCQQCMAEAATILARLTGASRSPVEAPPAAPAPTLAAPVQTPSAASQGPAKATSASTSGQVEQGAVDLVVEFEGFRSAPYQDPVGVWTIGYGSTRDSQGQPITVATRPVTDPEARILVSRDLMAAAVAVNGNVAVALNANERAALQDFVYNLGIGNFKSSTLLRKLNAGDFAGAAVEFDKWDMAGGKVLAGLLRRRQAETALFQRT